MFFTKVSILLLFQRIFLPPNSPKTKIYWAIWFVFWWNLLYALALVITVLTECVGKEEIEARGGECINTYAVLIGASAINMISDLMIMVIPIAAVWNLHMLPPQKIRLSAVFAIGSLYDIHHQNLRSKANECLELYLQVPHDLDIRFRRRKALIRLLW